jgi:hypothetical protein
MSPSTHSVQANADSDIIHAPVVLDIEGLSLNADDRRRLQHPLTGGLILFARNWASRIQLTKVDACSASRPMASRTCLPCGVWVRCG